MVSRLRWAKAGRWSRAVRASGCGWPAPFSGPTSDWSDEPFRGLDRDTRAALMQFVREHWRNATLLCISHDVSETRAFDRVVVVDNGAIVEDGNPNALAASDSRFRRMLEIEDDVRTRLWANPVWRRVRRTPGGEQ